MSSQLAMTMMSAAEFLLSAVLASIFWRKSLQRRYPATGAYLVLRVVSTPVLWLLLEEQGGRFSVNSDLQRLSAQGYFAVYWAAYTVSAILLYFICLEVFKSALSAVPGLL